MSITWRDRGTAWLLASLFAAVVQAASPDDRLRESASIVASLVSESEIARDMAVRAIENAFAARRDAENALLEALRVSKPAECLAAQSKLDQQNVAAASAVVLATAAVRDAALSLVAADTVRALVKQGQDQKPTPDPAVILKQTEKPLAEAERNLKKASVSVEILKRQWLLPVNIAPVPAEEKSSRWWRFGR